MTLRQQQPLVPGMCYQTAARFSPAASACRQQPMIDPQVRRLRSQPAPTTDAARGYGEPACQMERNASGLEILHVPARSVQSGNRGGWHKSSILRGFLLSVPTPVPLEKRAIRPSTPLGPVSCAPWLLAQAFTVLCVNLKQILVPVPLRKIDAEATGRSSGPPQCKGSACAVASGDSKVGNPALVRRIVPLTACWCQWFCDAEGSRTGCG